ncbi:aliphatic sulfonate ABC transporter substrate-binding protein [Pelosinus sp. sgz500959]|uniref:aliphatic sulfonate ABC transporter substrate-binding protein n=1 Tax=Pelosinus sp. sgz500959 TaxID=3242472 RepID=UPI003671C1BB
MFKTIRSLGKRVIPAAFLLILTVLLLTGCGSATTKDKTASIKLDYAYYNPLSLVLKEKGWLEEEFAKDGVKVEWVQSLGSNKSLELLNGSSVDFGSTAGAAALIGKANGNPIKSVYVYSKPEWTALVTRPDSGIKTVADLKGKKVAVTRGTDPHIFLLRVLEQNGLTDKDIQLVALQHPDGKNALEKGDVDAWSGLDPLMAQEEVEKNGQLFFRDANLNTYGVLNVREAFAQKNPQYVEKVLRGYEKARKWALANPAEYQKIVEKEAKLSEAVAAKVLGRTDLSNSVIGEEQKTAIIAAGNILLKNGIVSQGTDIGKVVSDLIDSQYINKISKE